MTVFAMKIRLLALLSALITCPLTHSLENGLAQLPPMGFNTWNAFGCNITEEKVKTMLSRIVHHKLRDLGYSYFNIDDCWMADERGSSGELQPAAAFPSGMQAMGDKIHSNGFKFGLYTSRGAKTCEEKAGSLGHEAKDAETLAAWGVDYLKHDGCYDTECFFDWRRPEENATLEAEVCHARNRQSVLNKYGKMRDALNATGRPILYEVCGWEPWYAPVGGQLSNVFRIGGDVMEWGQVFETTQLMRQVMAMGGRGGWAHADMLLGSSSGAMLNLTPIQSRAQFSLWAIFPAPLIVGANVLEMTDWDLETYSNPDVIAVNQDASSEFATLVLDNCPEFPEISLSSDGFSVYKVLSQHIKDTSGKVFATYQPAPDCSQAWSRKMANGDIVLVLVNFGAEPENVTLALSKVVPQNTTFTARELWEGTEWNDLEDYDSITFSLAPKGGHAMMRLEAMQPHAVRLPGPSLVVEATQPTHRDVTRHNHRAKALAASGHRQAFSAGRHLRHAVVKGRKRGLKARKHLGA